MGLDIRYARSGAVSIAYQVVGEGDTDLLFVPDFVSNLVYAWESPHWREFYERLARSFRLILFDKRGTGLSDLGGQFPSLETRMDDVRAVLDATGSASAAGRSRPSSSPRTSTSSARPGACRSRSACSRTVPARPNSSRWRKRRSRRASEGGVDSLQVRQRSWGE